MLELELAAHQSLFIVLDDKEDATKPTLSEPPMLTTRLRSRWSVDFASAVGPSPETMELESLQDLSEFPNASRRYFAGRATYTNHFSCARRRA